LKQILSGIVEIQRIKGVTMEKTGKLRGVALALALILGFGAVMVSTAQAQRREDDRSQNRTQRQDRAQRDDRWGNNVPNRGRGNNESWQREQWERNHNNAYRGYPYGNYGNYGNYGYNGPYRNNGYYGGYPGGGYYGGGYPYGGYGNYGSYGGYGGNSGSEAHGYRDGLNRGREDARSGRYPSPNNSEHFRNGNPAYRAGFARGYRDGFGQFGGGGGRYGGYRPF
jgi:hypothetical protein